MNKKLVMLLTGFDNNLDFDQCDATVGTNYTKIWSEPNPINFLGITNAVPA